MPSSQPDPCRFFFCHLQKTAGTSLFHRLRRHFGNDHVYPNESDGPIGDSVISVSNLLARWQARGQEIHLVTGHFPLCTRELLGGSFHTFTVLREPVARTLSFLRHYRLRSPADRHKSLEALYDNRFLFQTLIQNHMVKMLSLSARDMKGGALTKTRFTREHLEVARTRLVDLDVVGVQDQLEAFCDALSQRFGFRLGPPVTVNRTAPVEVAASFLQRIAEDNALDVELYAYARELLAERHAGARTELPQ